MLDNIIQAYQFLAKGGPVMIFIALASIMALAIVIEKAYTLRKILVFPDHFLKKFDKLCSEKKLDELMQLCMLHNLPLSRLSLQALQSTSQNIEADLEIAGRQEVEQMERNLNMLGSIASAAPLLGLLGTVTGMIKTFAAIKVIGVGDPLQLSAGISEALINTAAGLLVAIPAFVLHRYFYKKIDVYTLRLEAMMHHLLTVVIKPKR